MEKSGKATGRIADIGIDFLQPQEYFWDKVKKSSPNPQDVKALQIGLIKTLPTKVPQLSDKSCEHPSSSKSKPTSKESQHSSQSNKLPKKSKDNVTNVKQSKGIDGSQTTSDLGTADVDVSTAREKSSEPEIVSDKRSRSNSVASELATSDSNDHVAIIEVVKCKDSVNDRKHTHKKKKDKMKRKSRHAKHFKHKMNDPKLKMTVYVRLLRLTEETIHKWCKAGNSYLKTKDNTMSSTSKQKSFPKLLMKNKTSSSGMRPQNLVSSSEQSEDSDVQSDLSAKFSRAPKKRHKSRRQIQHQEKKSKKFRKLSSSSEHSTAAQEPQLKSTNKSFPMLKKKRHSSSSSVECNADDESSKVFGQTEHSQHDGNSNVAAVSKPESNIERESTEEADKPDQKIAEQLFSSDDSSVPPTSFKEFKVNLVSGAAKSKRKTATLSKKFIHSSDDANDDNSSHKTKGASGLRPTEKKKNKLSKLLLKRKGAKGRGAVVSSSEDSNGSLVPKQAKKPPQKVTKKLNRNAVDDSKKCEGHEVGKSLGRGWRIPLLSKVQKKADFSCVTISEDSKEAETKKASEFQFGFLKADESNDANITNVDKPTEKIAEVISKEKLDSEQEAECTTTWDARSDNARGDDGSSDNEEVSCAAWELNSGVDDDSYTQEDDEKDNEQAEEQEEECSTTWEMQPDHDLKGESNSRDWEESDSSDKWRYRSRRENTFDSRRTESGRYYPRDKHRSWREDRSRREDHSPVRESRFREPWRDRRQDYDRHSHYHSSNDWYKLRERETSRRSRSRERDSRRREYSRERRETFHNRHTSRESSSRSKYRDINADLVEAYDLMHSVESDSEQRAHENMELNNLICEEFFIMKGSSGGDCDEEMETSHSKPDAEGSTVDSTA